MRLNPSKKILAIKFVKFGLVGLSGIAVNMGVLWLLTERIGLYYLVSSVIAIFLSIMNNFLWNDRWTWRERRLPGIRAFWIRFLKFSLVSCVTAYGGNWGILYVLTRFLNVHYLIANLIGIAAAAVLNFIINHIWTFRI
jgi:dolichol-phosphate mannosyltransferase